MNVKHIEYPCFAELSETSSGNKMPRNHKTPFSRENVPIHDIVKHEEPRMLSFLLCKLNPLSVRVLSLHQCICTTKRKA